MELNFQPFSEIPLVDLFLISMLFLRYLKCLVLKKDKKTYFALILKSSSLKLWQE